MSVFRCLRARSRRKRVRARSDAVCPSFSPQQPQTTQYSTIPSLHDDKLRSPSSIIDAHDARISAAVQAMGMGPPVIVAQGISVSREGLCAWAHNGGRFNHCARVVAECACITLCTHAPWLSPGCTTHDANISLAVVVFYRCMHVYKRTYGIHTPGIPGPKVPRVARGDRPRPPRPLATCSWYVL